MKACIIVIGDEILLGNVIDTNSGAISRALDTIGLSTGRVITIGDGRRDITDTVSCSIADYPLVITTGGLGPTRDDITKSALMDVFGGQLRHDVEVMQRVEAMFARRGLKMNDLTASQALVPSTARALENRWGTAPGLLFEKDGHYLISLPGVPRETEPMLTEIVMPLLRTLLPNAAGLNAHRTLLVAGITESGLAESLEPWESTLPVGLHLAYLPSHGVIRLRLDGHGNDAGAVAAMLDSVFNELKRRVEPWLLGDADKPVARLLLEALEAKGLSIATAESCTGGNIAHEITLTPGSSAVMKGGVVAYANEVKSRILGVDPVVIESVGAVSEEVARMMAEGVARACGTEVAVSTTGIAGPSGAVSGKPVGTVWIGVHCCGKTIATLHHFGGSRRQIIEYATNAALVGALRVVMGV